jgi:hypothetical protein
MFKLSICPRNKGICAVIFANIFAAAMLDPAFFGPPTYNKTNVTLVAR